MNYESRYWGLIYDEMMEGDLSGWLEANRRFYTAHLAHIDGPILECACGTGLIMLHLLERGLDLYGFDASDAMLKALGRKASDDIERRISRQTLDAFRYDIRFDAIIIPTNSFSMLTTPSSQVETLNRIHAHLSPGGQLLMDLRHWDEGLVMENAEGIEGRWHEWPHPEGGTIRQRVVGEPHDFDNRVFRDRCYFEYRDDKEDFPMTARWIFQDEFEELLRSAGFRDITVETNNGVDYWSARINSTTASSDGS